MAQASEHSPEDRALDALMAAAFRAEEPDKEVTLGEAKKLTEDTSALSPEDEAAFASLGPDFVQRLLSQQGFKEPTPGEEHEALDEKMEEACAMMNRGRKGDEVSEETLREIERKRRELLGEPESETELDKEAENGS